MDSINASGMLHNPNQSIASSFGDQTNYLQLSNVRDLQFQDELQESNRALAYSGRNIQAISIGGQPQLMNISGTSFRRSSANVNEHQNQQNRYDSNYQQGPEISYRQGEPQLLRIESNPSQQQTLMNPILTSALEQSIRGSQVSSRQPNIQAPFNNNPINGSQISNQNMQTHQQSNIRQSRASQNIQNQSIINGSQILNSQHSARNQIQTHIQTQNINNNSRISNSNHSNILLNQPSLVRQTTVQGPQQSISKRTIVNSNMNSVQTSQVIENNFEPMTQINNSTVQQQSIHKQQIVHESRNSNISRRDGSNINMYQSQQSQQFQQTQQQSQHFEQGQDIMQSSQIIANNMKNSIHSQIGSGLIANQDQTSQINNRLAGSIAQSIKSNKSINQNGMNFHQSQVEVFDLNNRSRMSNVSNNFQNNIPLSPRANGTSNVIITQTRTSQIQEMPSNLIPRQSIVSQQSRQNQMRQSNIAIQNQIRSSQINNQIASGLNNMINQNSRNSAISRSNVSSRIQHEFNAIITPPPTQSQILRNQHIMNVAPINDRITSQIFQNNTLTSQVIPGITTMKRTTTIVEETPIGPSPQLLIFQSFFVRIKQILGFDPNANIEQTIICLSSFLNQNKYEYQQLQKQLQSNNINQQQSKVLIQKLNYQKYNLENQLGNLKRLLESQIYKNQLIQQKSNQHRVQHMMNSQLKQKQYETIINNLQMIINQKQQRSKFYQFKLQQNSRIKNQEIMYMKQDYQNRIMNIQKLKNQTQQSAAYWKKIAQDLARNKSLLEHDVLNRELLIQNIQNEKQKMHNQMNNYISRISNLECQQGQSRNQISSLQNALANNQHSAHTTSIYQTHHRQIIEHQTHISELQRTLSNLQTMKMQRDNLINIENSLRNELQIKNANIQDLIMTYEAKISQLNAKLHMSHSQFQQLKITMQSHISITVQNQIDQLRQNNNILVEKLMRMDKQILQNRNKYNDDQIVRLKQHYETQLGRYKNMLDNFKLKSQQDLCFQQNRYTELLNNYQHQKIRYQQLFDQQKNRLLATQKNYSKLYHQHVGEKNISSDERQRNGRLQKQLNNYQIKNKSLQSMVNNLRQDYQNLQNTIRQIKSQKQRIQTNHRTQISRIITDRSNGFDSQKNKLLFQLSDRQNKITDLLRELQLKNKEIADQRIKNISLNNQSFPNPINLNVEIQQKMQTIYNLNSQIVALNSRLILLEESLNQLNRKNISLESRLKDQNIQYLKQNYTLKIRIQELQIIIAQLRSDLHKSSLNKHIQTSTTILPSSNNITSLENIKSQKSIHQPVVNAVSRVEIQKTMTNFDTPSSVTRNQSIEKLKTASRINYTQVAGTPIHTTNQTISRTITAQTAVPSYPNSQLTYAPIASVQAPMTSSSKRVVVNRSPTPPRHVQIRTPPKIQQITQVQPIINYKTTSTANVKSVNKFASRLQKPKIIQNRPRIQIKVSKPSQNRQRSNSRQIVHINNRQRSRSRSPIRLPLSPPARIDNHIVQTNVGMITSNIRSPIVTTQTLTNIRSTPNLLSSQIKVEQMNNSISKQIVQKSFQQQQLRVSSVQDNTFKPTIQSFVSQGSNGMMLMQKDTIANGACCNFKP